MINPLQNIGWHVNFVFFEITPKSFNVGCSGGFYGGCSGIWNNRKKDIHKVLDNRWMD